MVEIILTETERNKYIRQIRIPEIGPEGQALIKKSSVLVIGAGALGCAALQYLVAAGVGTIGIVDNDWVDETNLHRQILYNVHDIGRPKPSAAIEKLKLLNPEVDLISHFLRFNKEVALNIAKPYNIIVDCSDNFATRYLVNDTAVLLDKPVVYGVIHKFIGQLIVLNYQNGPTLRCIIPDQPHPLEIPTCAETGVIGTIAGVIGSLQANEVLKIILNKEAVLSDKLFSFDALSFTSHFVPFIRDPEYSQVKALGEYTDLCLTEKEPVNSVTPGDLRTMLEINPQIKLIDLREPENVTDLGFETVSIPYYKISEYIPELLTYECAVFYCNYGIRSSYVITYLKKLHNRRNLFQLVM